MDSLDKKYYKIREVSEIIGVPPSTLRFWEKQFPSISPKRNSGRTRYYTPGDIERIQMIHYLLKDKGLKIEAAQEVLAKKSTWGIEAGKSAGTPAPGARRVAVDA